MQHRNREVTIVLCTAAVAGVSDRIHQTSMNDSEQNFEDLKQLLKLKRYEIPPPGYFNNFSGQVISAIREERTGSVASRVNPQTSWLVRFLSIFDSRPGLMGGLATSLM